MKKRTLHREKLYHEVWSKPMTKLAKEYGINVYQLTKVCDELEIPRPETGYWSKLKYGKRVHQKPLPQSEKSSYQFKTDKLNPEHLNQQLPEGYKPIVVKDQLRNPHPLVKQTLQNLKERHFNDNYGRLKARYPGNLNVLVSKKQLNRAMRIFDALIRELIRQGYEVGNGTKHDRNYTYIRVGEDECFISIQEEGKRRRKENPKYSWDEYDYYTTGKLKLMISSSFFMYTCRSISDGKTQTIEERIGKFFPIILDLIEKEKNYRIEREDSERKANIARRLRSQKEREYQAELNRREELEILSKQYTNAAYIYEFIQEVEAAIEMKDLSIEQVYRFHEWKVWATEHADRLNPVKQMIPKILAD